MSITWYNPNIKSPTVSIATYGLVFSNGSAEVMGNPTYILLGFSKEDSTLYVKPTDEKSTESIEFRAKYDISQNFVRINDKNFVKFLESQLNENIKFGNKVMKFDAKWDEENKMLIVKIENPEDDDDN